MKAITIHEFGGPEVLQFEEVDRPEPKENEVLVEVFSSSLNPVDAKSIEKGSKYNASIHLPATLGMDLAGRVFSVGPNVKKFTAGDLVYGQASVLRKGSGSFAEYAVTSESSLAMIPPKISFNEAAAIPLAACSAYQAIYDKMQLKQGQRVLIHGGSGGIGSFAIQMARHLGAYVIATATGEGIDFLKRLNVDEVIDYKTANIEQHATNIDAVLDTVGGETYKKSFQIVKKGGVIVSMLMPPDEELMKKYGVRAELEMTEINTEVLTKISELIADNALRVYIAETFQLKETKQAYEAMQKQRILGKIAVEIAHNHN